MSRTRLATLDPITRRDAASDFFAEENVPTHAITMGVATILEARKVVLIAQGEHKAGIIRETAEGPPTPRVPATPASTPRRLAVARLGRGRQADRHRHALGRGARRLDGSDDQAGRPVAMGKDGQGPAQARQRRFSQSWAAPIAAQSWAGRAVAHRVFRWMMDTINYHPAGKQPQKVICFSPHPDDDVISMGGTLIRLVEDQHEVHVAYMTSGNIAVFDHDARRVADLVTEYNRMFSVDTDKSHAIEAKVANDLQHKTAGQSDTAEVLAIKTLIRWSEAKAGAFVAGCQEENLHFLDLPFYRTGTIAKKPISEEDVKIIRELIVRLNPAQIYVAGDLSDPHGTHRVCAEAIFRALGDDRSVGRGPRFCSIAVPGRNGHRTRSRSRCRSVRTTGPQAGGDFPARIAKGFGPLPRPGRQPRILAAGRRPQPQHGDSVQPDRPARIFCARGLCPLERRADLRLAIREPTHRAAGVPRSPALKSSTDAAIGRRPVRMIQPGGFRVAKGRIIRPGLRRHPPCRDAPRRIAKNV